MVDAEFRWKNNRDMRDAAQRIRDLQSAVNRNLESAMEEATLRVMADARREVEVDTGRLRASIQQEVERIGKEIVRGMVGSNVPYAPFQEIIHPYLRPAIEKNRAKIRELFEDAVRDAVEEVS